MRNFAGPKKELKQNNNMKKIRLAVLATALLCLAAPAQAQKGNNKKRAAATQTQKATVQKSMETFSSTDSLAYAMGLVQAGGLEEYLKNQRNVNLDQFLSEFLKGLDAGAAMKEKSKEDAYEAGIQIGMQVARSMVPQLEKDVFGDDKTQSLSVSKMLQGMKDGLNKSGMMTTEAASAFGEQKMMSLKQASILKLYGANKEAGEKFLRENATREGVQTLDGGVQYKVLTAGNGAVPTSSDRVRVHYEGRTVDGTVFDSSYKRGEPTTFRADQVIKGWTTALTHMPVGSTWEVYIPYEQAYGERGAGEDIKPFSMLIFKIELIEIVKDDNTPAKDGKK